MARKLYNVQGLVDEIRAQVDEQNIDSVDTTRDILPTLNRGQDYAMNILARKYPDPFITSQTITLSSSDNTYELPEDCFEDRIMKVVISISGVQQEVRRVSFYDAWKWTSTNNRVPIPVAYYIQGRNIVFVPGSGGQYPAIIYYIKQSEELVLPQGRVTVINQASNYVIVDGLGDDLTSESDQLNSYVNIVDSQSGIIKWSGQIQNIDGDRITFRSSPQRTTVLGRTIQTALPLPAADIQVELDDTLCVVKGSAVPYFQQPMANFLIQFTVAEIIRKLGGDAATEETILKKFESQVSEIWQGRENTKVKQNRSRAWGNVRTRFLAGRY